MEEAAVIGVRATLVLLGFLVRSDAVLVEVRDKGRPLSWKASSFLAVGVTSLLIPVIHRMGQPVDIR